MAAPSSVAARGLRLGTPWEMRAALTRSHLSDGRCVGWVGPVTPGTTTVVDGELEVRPPARLARRFGDHDFFARWTRAECAAKLLDVPIALWWHRHGLEVPARLGLTLVTLRPARLDPNLIVTVGTGPSRPGGWDVSGNEVASAGVASAPDPARRRCESASGCAERRQRRRWGCGATDAAAALTDMT